MDTPRHPRHRLVSNILLTVLPAVVLFVAGGLSDTPMGLLVVMAEPLLLALGLTITAWALLERHTLLAGAMAASLVAGGFSLHEPRFDLDPLPPGPSWLRELRGCAMLAKPAKGPVRLVTWTVDGTAGVSHGVDVILSIKPDIVVLLGTADPDIGGRIQEALEGEAKFVRSGTGGGGMLAVVRGSFQYCGDDTDEWHLELPGSNSASAMIGFPHVTEIGVVPLMMTRLAQMSGPQDWLSWSARVIEGATVSGQAAQTIGSRSLVLLGDLQAPPTALALASPLKASGLLWARSGPNWPTQIYGMPFWTQHARDQVWTGPDWHVQSSRVLPQPQQVRAPVVVDLIPNQVK